MANDDAGVVSQKFALGRIVATHDALAELAAAGEDALPYLARHVRGDWGDLDAEDKKENEVDNSIEEIQSRECPGRLQVATGDSNKSRNRSGF